jgi:hypothetical protein
VSNHRLIPITLVFAFGVARATAAEGPVWNPAKTWVFAVSATEWKFDRTLNMPRKGREDAELIDTLKARGVPADHIAFLKDRQGTLAHIRATFDALLARSRKGDFLIFYFQGHGSRDIVGRRSEYYFVNYDARDDNDKSFLYMAEVVTTLQSKFKGSHALLLADCCCSGGLLVEARKHPAPVALACLTSVFAHNGSCGAWTYTDSLIRAFRGDPATDVDGDGSVTLRDLERYVDHRMAFVENQKSAYGTFGAFDDGLRLAPAGKRPFPEYGRDVEVLHGKAWERATVIDAASGKYRVALAEGGERSGIPANKVREPHYKQLPIGTKVTAQNDDDHWLPGTVVKAHLGLHYVHFDKDKSKDGLLNEWVAPDRIKVRP